MDYWSSLGWKNSIPFHSIPVFHPLFVGRWDEVDVKECECVPGSDLKGTLVLSK